MFVLTAFIVSNVINFFPLLFSVFAFYDGDLKKLIFAVDFYGIKIFGGYAEIKDGLVFVHHSRKKAFAVKLVSFKPVSFKPKYLSVVKITELKAFVAVKSDETGIGAYVFGNVIIDLFSEQIKLLINENALVADVAVAEDGKTRLYFKTSALVNLFGITTVISMMLWEKIWKPSKKKKTS